MFAFECSNPVWGRTTNPYNENYTCGGSSGGEAALLAMDGSAIGIGSDIGGSLRIPAAYCGIYSLKPGGGRVSLVGAKGDFFLFRITGFDAQRFAKALFLDLTASWPWRVPWAGMPARRFRRLVLCILLANFDFSVLSKILS